MKVTTIRHRDGFTLIELLIALTILAVVIAGIVNMFTQTVDYHTGQEMMTTTSQDLRAAKLLMSQEIREAGLNPKEATGIGFQLSGDDRYNTDANSIHLTRDLYKKDALGNWVDGYDQKTNGPDEDVSYYRTNDSCIPGAPVGAILAAGNPAPGCLRRDTGGGGQEEVMPGVTQLQFTYYNKNNVVIPPATLTTIGALEDIHTVEVILTGQVAQPNKVEHAGRAAELSQTLQFRVLARNAK